MITLSRKALFAGIAGTLILAAVMSALFIQSGARAQNAAPSRALVQPPAAAGLPAGLYPADRFRIEIDGIMLSAEYWYVSGLEIKKDVVSTYSTEFGRYLKSAGNTVYAPEGITLRGPYHDEIYNWFRNPVEKRAGSIVILGETGTEVMRYNFFEAWPSSYKLGPFSTGGTAGPANAEVILQEEVVLQVEIIERG